MLIRSFILLALPFLQSPAQTKQKPTFADALIQSRTPIVLAGGKFSAPGSNTFTQAVTQSRFVLIGEDHITREIPEFTAALCDVMHPDAYAVETGPDAARFVNGLLHSTERIQIVAARNREQPNNMAFLDIREENDLAAHCATASRTPYFQLWGLDQEFLGSAGTLLEDMLATNPGPRSREAIAIARAKERNAELAARRTGDFLKLFVISSTDADLHSLQEAVNADGNAATRDLLHEFTMSRTIYQLNTNGSPDANRLRAELFKQHFLSDYLPFEAKVPAPRVLFKFGDFHTGKGFSYLHQRDLGNFVAELADAERTQSLHLLVLGARGTHAALRGYAKPMDREPFSIAEDPSYGWLTPAVADLLPQQVDGPGPTLTLFDLRQLRFRHIELPPEWERVIYSYDLFVLIPKITPASPIE